jgi:hypothetical protein
MNMNPKQHSYKADRSVRKVFVRGLIVLVVVGLSLALWPRSGSEIAPDTAEQNASTAVESLSQPLPASHSASGSQMRVLAQEIVPAAATEKQPWEDLWTAFLAAQALTDPMEQSAALSRCMEGLTPEMAATLLANLNPADLKTAAARQLFDHWATANPGAAAVWAQSQADPETCQSFMNVAAMRWAVTDLSKAAAWARNLPEGNSRTEIMAAVGSEAVRSNPLEAMRLGIEMPAGTAQADLICRASAEWAVTDRDSAMEWAEQIEDKDLRQRVTEQIVVASADQDPVKVATLALQQLTPGVEQDRAIVSIVQRLVQTDPVGASAWVSGFPENALGRDAMDNLVNLWADRDLVAPGNWLLTLPTGELRNTGILAYSRVLTRTEEAKAWFGLMPAGKN